MLFIISILFRCILYHAYSDPIFWHLVPTVGKEDKKEISSIVISQILQFI